MAYTTTGLPNNGRTNFFNFQYDDTLSKARGLDLVADVMQYCDDDLAVLVAWFSGRSLDMSPPINVSFANPTTAQGASWFGFGPWPLQVTIGMGEVAMATGTPTMMARYLLVSEVSEMYMRAFSAYTLNPWFASGEGSKGEGLSRFLGAQLVFKAYPGMRAVPAQASAPFAVSNFWLNSTRDNHIDDNVDDILPDAITGLATLFLFYLHDQLGFSIEDIINAGDASLSKVYQNLTQDSWSNAWGKFRPLVDAHCPNVVQANGSFSPQYFPPDDSIFPVSDLSWFTAPVEVSWVSNGGPNIVTVMVDHPAKVALVIRMTSDDQTVIPAFSMTVVPSATSVWAALIVLPQAAGFVSKTVTMTASYAGRTLTQAIRVVRPEQLRLPALEITFDPSADFCQPGFIENTSETFGLKSLGMFVNRTGLVFSWSVVGAAAGALNQSTLTIASLPAAGTTVTVKVTVRNALNLQATGTLVFQTASVQTGLVALQKQLRCRLSGLRNGALSIPPWVPVEKAQTLVEQITLLEKQVIQVKKATTQVTALLKSMKAMNKSIR